jgi:hypothetical protein
MAVVSLKTALLDPATWLQVSDHLDRLLELRPALRQQWLNDLTAREPSIAGVLHKLLDAPDDASGLLQSSRLAVIELATQPASKSRACISKG